MSALIQTPMTISSICNVLVGFKNHSHKHTRSPYVSFPVKEEAKMCELLLKMSTKKFKPIDVESYPRELFEQLIEFGFLKKKSDYAIKDYILHKLNLLNENRNIVIRFDGCEYVVTSFCFMAFYKQDSGEFIKEKVLLPRWVRQFSLFVHELLTGQIALDASVNKFKKKLKKYGVIVPEEESKNFMTLFLSQCILSKSLIAELPRHYQNILDEKANNQSDLVLNKEIELLGSELDKDKLKKTFQYCSNWLIDASPSILITDPATHVKQVLWLSEHQLNLLKQLISQKITIADLDSETVILFQIAEIIYSESEIFVRRNHWQEIIKDAKQQLSATAIFKLEKILPPVALAIARRYLCLKDKQKLLIRDKANGDIEGRFWVHRDPFIFYLQNQLQTIMNQILFTPVKIGHNALSIYKKGATLPVHSDDVKAFEWVLSLPIETIPYRAEDQAWPIYVDNGKEKISVNLTAGDIIAINPQMPHWRNVLEDHQLNIVFLWFVSNSFSGYINGHMVN